MNFENSWMKFKITLVLILFISLAISQNNPNDCVNALVICGNSSLGIEPDGIGFDEFSLPGNHVPSCYNFIYHRIWFKFEIVESGIFTFDLIPDNGIDDYDFAIFGPTGDCTSLGHAIRCSSTHPGAAGVSANTGLNMTETDTEEGPGEDGNGYLRYIDAEAGDVYYLLVDRAEGSGPFSLFYTGTAKLPNAVEAHQPENLYQCDSDGRQDESTDFNLDSQTDIIRGNQTGVVVTYHETLNDASIGINPLPNIYRNRSNPQTIYARIEKNNGCSDITSFDLIVGNPEVLTPQDVVLCSYGDSETYFLDDIIPSLISQPNDYVFTYHHSEEDATTNENPIGPTIEFTRTPYTVFIRVTDRVDPDCYSITSFKGYIKSIALAGQPSNVELCDNNRDGRVQVNLNDKKTEVLNGRDPSAFEILFFPSQEDRLAGTNTISGNFETEGSHQTIYVTFIDKETQCFDHVQFAINVNAVPDPIFEQDTYILCINSSDAIPISVETSPGYYVWSTGEEGRNLNRIFIDSPGTYSVTVANEHQCSYTATVEVFPSDVARILDLEIIDFNDSNNSVTVHVEGPGDYEFALNTPSDYQVETTFTGLKNGYHTIYVRDRNGCGTVSKEFLVLDYPRFFTPNNDGVNDYWQIKGINEFPKSKIYIFDRYGKYLRQISTFSKGWDGTNEKGKPLPSSDYWFVIDIENRPNYRGHFTLKR